VSETITILRRVAEAAGGDPGADFRAGLSVGLAEAERRQPGFLDGLRRVKGAVPDQRRSSGACLCASGGVPFPKAPWRVR
jgi:hypothetical protein